MKKILFDTDIGSDIDDAVCLAYLLAHPECDLLGITTVSMRDAMTVRTAASLSPGARTTPSFRTTSQIAPTHSYSHLWMMMSRS